MSEQPVGEGRRRSRRTLWIVVGVVGGLVVLAIAAFPLHNLITMFSRVPEFPSLTANPDPSLRGTVAYLSDTNCVRVISASGSTSREVYCLPELDPQDAAAKGKPIGPQLVWLPDNRLQITMFRMPEQPGPTFRAGWQKIADITTGRIEDVPQSEVPTEANLSTRPTTSPTGQTVGHTSSPDGAVTVTLTGPTGTRTLLDAKGPGEYTYAMNAAFWAPGWKWIAADDGRILVIVPSDPAVVRVLVEPGAQGFGGDPNLSTFAMTDADLLG